MGVLLEAGYDLGALAACYVAIAGLLLCLAVTQQLAAVLNVGFLGVHPFAHIANGLNNHVVTALQDAVSGLEGVAARFESGLIDAFGMLIAIPLLLALGVQAALTYLWDHAIRPLIHSIADPISDIADNALSKARAAAKDAADAESSAAAYTRARVSSAIDTAESYVDREVSSLHRTLSSDIAAASSAVVGYVDVTVSKLRAAEDQAVANAVGLAATAKAAGIAAAQSALATAESEADAAVGAARRAADVAIADARAVSAEAVREAEAQAAVAIAAARTDAAALVDAARSDAAQALAQADAAGHAALDAVRSVAVDLGDELHTIEGAAGAAGVAALIASIPALATLVQSIAVESGLENAECRGKVKGICGTDPAAWANLLGGLAAIGFGFGLRDLYAIARPLADELAPIIREAA